MSDTLNHNDFPEKRLLTEDDMKIWENSSTKNDLMKFIVTLAEAVEDHENLQFEEPLSPAIQNTQTILLNSIENFIKDHPVANDEKTKSRFGKVEFRDFYDDLQKNAVDLISKTYPSLTTAQVNQLSIYLIESWGNKRRIDYGSGHELNFMCFLFGLTQYKIFSLHQDSVNLILVVFIKYLTIMRTLESQYWLEPAGSHGVWGLDDYHFLPFLFGAFQLAKHKHLRPMSIHDEEIVEMFKDKYLYFGCISFINSIKTSASLRWHSPMLDDISGVKKWSKVAEGMVKMYDAEVLKKLPIMQHFYFSQFLKCPDGISPPHEGIQGNIHDEELEEELSHMHNTYGDCCGIKVPSAFAAAAEINKKSHKPIPFD
ncbi:similar to Saccharomyces cerevisiae YPL152W RRD2 Activator of the phosphotyrosyl phosphatase activity of PP2A,peptidyl-prolyl cis/trans-isomerase [Maudiozyma saulgeensis]|uniref:Serine/threonine-protein phosphatase 2A activator n=1 Tax=Maudiozyma saulgeensis TaxID=1789683 RepID=A0A1X7RA82_9SACH|nr:similar to Saccharomyces cerevisiae YPL152W RRD2 Activator of the phosphotyrosyl phosphatase activity of PP2A,peptidyl-prolyl cis/trans-isomerase [Kazachstania saulgeensis]